MVAINAGPPFFSPQALPTLIAAFASMFLFRSVNARKHYQRINGQSIFYIVAFFAHKAEFFDDVASKKQVGKTQKPLTNPNSITQKSV